MCRRSKFSVGWAILPVTTMCNYKRIYSGTQTTPNAFNTLSGVMGI